MEFDTLLAGVGINVKTTAVALHRPRDPLGKAELRGFLENDDDLFEAVQSTHPRIQDATLKKRQTLASFVNKAPDELVFAGLFSQDGWQEMRAAELDAMPIFARLFASRRQIGDDWTFTKEAAEKGVPGRALFSLNRLPHLSEFVGRLVVADPVGRNHMRLAENLDLPILEITSVEDYAPPMPAWSDLVLTASDLATLPRQWAETLRTWRGVYLIVDETDGARYVGCAYGADNLLGRWQAHVARDHGVTKRLAVRDPASFRFSILETLHPSLRPEDVIAVENSWKDRLHTRAFGLNEN